MKSLARSSVIGSGLRIGHPSIKASHARVSDLCTRRGPAAAGTARRAARGATRTVGS
jgi:hypothetical protein